MATYFFSTDNGDDNNSGSQGSPFRTLSKGLHTIHAGDTLFGRRGTYNESIDSNDYPDSSFPCGDSFSKPVTIAGFQNEPVIITGGMNFPHRYIHHVIFDHLIIDGTHVKDCTISSDGAHDMRFQNGEVRNAGQGFPVQPPTKNFSCVILGEKWEFLHNDIYGSRYSYGFYIAADDCLIEGNNIYDNGGYGIQIFNGDPGKIASRNRVRNNHIHWNGFRSPNGQNSGIALSKADDNWIYNNFIYRNGGEAGIMVNESGSNTKIYHNSLWNNTGKGLYIKDGSNGTVCKNNIIYQEVGQPIDNQGNSTITETEPDTFTDDPNFADPDKSPKGTKGDFTLRLGSRAIKGGVNLTGVIDVDAMGTPRPQNGTYGFGAMEFTGGRVGPAAHTSFTTDPTDHVAGATLNTITVEIRDASGARVAGATNRVGILLAPFGQQVPQNTLTVVSVDSEQPGATARDGNKEFAVDGKEGTMWHTQYKGGTPGHPHHIIIDLHATYNVTGFAYIPRQDADLNGTVKNYEFYVSTNGTTWGTPVHTGAFAYNKYLKDVKFPPQSGRYVKFVSLTEGGGGPWASLAEMRIFHNGPAGTLHATSLLLNRNAVNGVATFADLRVDQPGTAYHLECFSDGLSSDSSTPFNILRG